MHDVSATRPRRVHRCCCSRPSWCRQPRSCRRCSRGRWPTPTWFGHRTSREASPPSPSDASSRAPTSAARLPARRSRCSARPLAGSSPSSPAAPTAPAPRPPPPTRRRWRSRPSAAKTTCSTSRSSPPSAAASRPSRWSTCCRCSPCPTFGCLSFSPSSRRSTASPPSPRRASRRCSTQPSLSPASGSRPPAPWR